MNRVKTGISVHDTMTNKPVMTTVDTSIKEASKLMTEQNVGSLIIHQDNHIRGIVTEEDFVRKAIYHNLDAKDTPVSHIMTKQVITIAPNKDIYDALVLMQNNNIRHLPVLDDKKLLGFITLKTILKIQPQLFDIIVDKIELKEEHRKAIEDQVADDDVCSTCGEISHRIIEVDGARLCAVCRRT